MRDLQYVGSTVTKFRTRFNNHKSKLNVHNKLTAENKTKDNCIYRHFNQPDHQGLTDVRVRLRDKCYNEARLGDREAQWAYRLRSVHPLGLNSDDSFSSRNSRYVRIRWLTEAPFCGIRFASMRTELRI